MRFADTLKGIDLKYVICSTCHRSKERSGTCLNCRPWSTNNHVIRV